MTAISFLCSVIRHLYVAEAFTLPKCESLFSFYVMKRNLIISSSCSLQVKNGQKVNVTGHDLKKKVWVQLPQETFSARISRMTEKDDKRFS